MSRELEWEFIIDANALIDYCDSDLKLLSLFSQYIGQVYIARSTFEKVRQVTESLAKKHHLAIRTPGSEIVMDVSARRGALAYDDRETLLLAKRNGWVCITNDKPLRIECKNEGVDCLWGLEPMRILVEHNIVSGKDVLVVARKIQLANPKYITDEIVNRFEKKIGEIEEKAKK